MDLLLTHGFFLAEDEKEQRIMKPYPPLGLLYLSSHLRAKGWGVEIYDSTFGTRAELNAVLHGGPPSVLGIAANLLTRRVAVEIIREAKVAGWKVVAGGPEPANYAAEYLAAGADAIVEGEGETALEDLLSVWRAGWNGLLERVPGLYLPGSRGEAVFTGQRRLIADLNAQPWPDRERIDIPAYLRAWRERHGMGSVSAITARGCPYHCRWCSHSVFGKTHRRRSPANVAAEVEWILEKYQPDMLWMADDVFTIHRGWLDEYAAELRTRRIRIPFECITRADRLDDAAAEALAGMGCFRVWIGSESGSDRVLARMERGVTAAQVREAVARARRHGIQTGMFLMWGYEGEELGDIEATVEHVQACNPDIYLTTVAYPIKGTPYYDETALRLVRPAGWSGTSDRDLKVAGRHSRRYYQFADEWLRSAVDLARGQGEAGTLESRIVQARMGMESVAAEVEA